MWVFDEYPTPLGSISMPRTGGSRAARSSVEAYHLMFALSFIFLLGAVTMYLGAREQKYGKYEKRRSI